MIVQRSGQVRATWRGCRCRRLLIGHAEVRKQAARGFAEAFEREPSLSLTDDQGRWTMLFNL